MKGENKNRVIGGVVTVAIISAVIGGALATDQLRIGSAAISSNATLSERNGSLQAQVHTGAFPAGVRPPAPFLGPFAHNAKGVTECGPAVKLMEGALKRKKFRKDAPRNCVGPATKKQIIAFQKSVHYKPTGTYNLVTHKALVKANGYTNEARRGLVYLQGKKIVRQRQHNVTIIAGHAHLVGGNTLSYSQSGSRTYFPSWPRIPPATDCSGFVTWIMWQAGFGNSVGYFGLGSVVGWTGTLAYQGHSVAPNKALQIGDLVFYPSDSAPYKPWGHVAMYIGRNQVISHGSVGVKLLPYNYRAVGEVRRYLSFVLIFFLMPLPAISLTTKKEEN